MQSQVLNFAGPFAPHCTAYRLYHCTKSYLAIFVQFATRPFYVKIISDLSTGNFLLSLRWLITRCGLPKCVYSDNGKNLVGVKNLFEAAEFQKFSANKGFK